MRIMGVGDITRYLKGLLEEDYYLQDVWIRGELTNYTQSSAGHRYFTLKDETAQLQCVLFRGNAFAVPPLRNGMAVIAHGHMSLYEARGNLQFYVDAIEPAGLGELHVRFEELKARLQAEGLFAPERKRTLPPVPSVIGVVTSLQAAALQDILRTLRLRCPLVRVIVAPAMVQGDGAAEQIAAGVDALNAQGEADVIIVARGGGSLEELWAFNEEIVARAIARSRVPVVSGVGHETDYTIADFVADLRASTPTAAATAVVPDMAAWQAAISETRQRLDHLAQSRLTVERSRLAISLHGLERIRPQQRIEDARQRVDELQAALALQLEHVLSLRGEQLHGMALRLQALSPLNTLGRGYAIVRRAADGALVASVTQVTPGQGLTIHLQDGTVAAIAGPRLPAAPDIAPAASLRATTGARASATQEARADMLPWDEKGDADD
jgi:exodeoxyribonuclease VII large subunit